MHYEIRCPACRSIDWWLDGFVIVENEAGDLDRHQAEPAAGDATAPWCCASCGFETPPWTQLARQLDTERSEAFAATGVAG